jgi:hypothetical protein
MVMAVSVTAVGETLKLGTPTPLFAMRSFDEAGNPRAYRMSNNAGAAWDVLPDGRFVMLQGPDTSANREIVVVEHWSNELQRLAPTD